MNIKAIKLLWAIMLINIMNASAVLAVDKSLEIAKDERSDNKPNIIILLADDLGYGELGSYGQKKIKTPFLDELAEQSMSFTNYYAGNALCSPSRAVLMTGIPSGHSSVRGNVGYHAERKEIDRVPIKVSEQTLAEMLKPAGYESIYFGKWHLDDPYNLETWATNRGFDHAVQGQWKRRGGKVSINHNIDWVNGLSETRVYDHKKYSCMDEFRTDQAIDYFEQRESNNPFFLFMSYRVPHAHEFEIRNKTMYKKQGWPEIERRHAARISMLDEQIGRLMRYLKAIGELDNTIVIVTSDNGGHTENGHDWRFFNSNGEYRGHKRDLYEGGIRVPFFVYWPNNVAAGSTNDHIGAFHDIMPTLADIAGVKLPEQSNGISILPTLLGNKQLQHDFLYWELHLNFKPKKGNDKGFRQAIRQGNWKAVRYGIKSKTELYDLSQDKSESNNIAAKYPEKTAELTALFKASRQSTEHFKYGGNLLNTSDEQ